MSEQLYTAKKAKEYYDLIKIAERYCRGVEQLCWEYDSFTPPYGQDKREYARMVAEGFNEALKNYEQRVPEDFREAFNDIIDVDELRRMFGKRIEKLL